MSNYKSFEDYLNSQEFEREVMGFGRIAWRVAAEEAEIHNCIDGRDPDEVLGQGIGHLLSALLFNPNGSRPTPCTASIIGCAFRDYLFTEDEEGVAEYNELMSAVEKAMNKIRKLHLKYNGEKLIHNNSDHHHWPNESGICQKFPELDIQFEAQQKENNE